jgi:hypothetical protein
MKRETFERAKAVDARITQLKGIVETMRRTSDKCGKSNKPPLIRLLNQRRYSDEPTQGVMLLFDRDNTHGYEIEITVEMLDKLIAIFEEDLKTQEDLYESL